MKLPFYNPKDNDSPCMSRRLCSVCNHMEQHHVHRAAFREKYDGVPEDGVSCPFTNAWNEIPEKKIVLAKRAAMSAENICKFLELLASRDRVDASTRIKRKAACADCDYLADRDGDAYCGVPESSGGCGCHVKPPKAMNLTMNGVDITRYSEAQGALCLHPNREQGKGWPK